MGVTVGAAVAGTFFALVGAGLIGCKNIRQSILVLNSFYSVFYYRSQHGGLSGGFNNISQNAPQTTPAPQINTPPAVPTEGPAMVQPVKSDTTIITEKPSNDLLFG